MRDRLHPLRRKALLFALITIGTIGVSRAQIAQGQETTIAGRELIERLARLDEGQKRLDQRLEEGQKRIDQRIDALSLRIADLQKNLGERIDELKQFMLWGFGVTFAGMFALIGFVIWDRRTALNPAI